MAIGTLVGAVLYVRNFFSPLQEVAFFLNSYQYINYIPKPRDFTLVIMSNYNCHLII